MDIIPLINMQSASVFSNSASERASADARFARDTAAPVDPTQLPAPIKGLGIAPLDMFLVGDNDDVPLPPEPPRDLATQVEPWQPPEGDTETPKTETPPVGTEAPPHPQPDLARAVQALSGEDTTPTIDIRR